MLARLLRAPGHRKHKDMSTIQSRAACGFRTSAARSSSAPSRPASCSSPACLGSEKQQRGTQSSFCNFHPYASYPNVPPKPAAFYTVQLKTYALRPVWKNSPGPAEHCGRLSPSDIGSATAGDGGATCPPSATQSKATLPPRSSSSASAPSGAQAKSASFAGASARNGRAAPSPCQAKSPAGA